MTEKVRKVYVGSFCSDCGLENYPHDCVAELKRQLAEMKAKCPPLVKRATGRIIPDLTGREHVCEWQGKVKVSRRNDDTHSPEPWTFCIEEEGRSINGFLCELEEADIRRIVACVNAMKGIADPESYRRGPTEGR